MRLSNQKTKPSYLQKHQKQTIVEDNQNIEGIKILKINEENVIWHSQKLVTTERNQGEDEVHLGNMESASSFIHSTEYSQNNPEFHLKQNLSSKLNQEPIYQSRQQQIKQPQLIQFQSNQYVPLQQILNSHSQTSSTSQTTCNKRYNYQYQQTLPFKNNQQLFFSNSKQAPQQSPLNSDNQYFIKHRLCQSDAKNPFSSHSEQQASSQFCAPSQFSCENISNQERQQSHQIKGTASNKRSLSPTLSKIRNPSPLRISSGLFIRSVSPAQNTCQYHSPNRNKVSTPANKPNINSPNTQSRELTPSKIQNIDITQDKNKELSDKLEQVTEEIKKFKKEQQQVLEEKNKQLGRALQELEKLLIDNTMLSEKYCKAQEQIKFKLIEMTEIKQNHLEEMESIRTEYKLECNKLIDQEIEKIVRPLMEEKAKLENSIIRYKEAEETERVGENERRLLQKQYEEIVQKNQKVLKENEEIVAQNDYLLNENVILKEEREQLIRQIKLLQKNMDNSDKINLELIIEKGQLEDKYEGISQEMVIVREQFLKYLKILKTFKSVNKSGEQSSDNSDQDANLLQSIKEFQYFSIKQTSNLDENLQSSIRESVEKEEQLYSQISDNQNKVEEQRNEQSQKKENYSVLNQYDYKQSSINTNLNSRQSQNISSIEEEQKQSKTTHKRLKSIEDRELRLICKDNEQVQQQQQQQQQKEDQQYSTYSNRYLIEIGDRRVIAESQSDEFSFIQKEDFSIDKSNQIINPLKYQMKVQSIQGNDSSKNIKIQNESGFDKKLLNNQLEFERKLKNVECIESVQITSQDNEIQADREQEKYRMHKSNNCFIDNNSAKNKNSNQLEKTHSTSTQFKSQVNGSQDLTSDFNCVSSSKQQFIQNNTRENFDELKRKYQQTVQALLNLKTGRPIAQSLNGDYSLPQEILQHQIQNVEDKHQ